MSEKKEMVGMDRKFCPVYVGDTIIDASGVKYTISERGTCVNAAGKDYAFSDLHGPELYVDGPATSGRVIAQQPAAVEDPAPEVKLLPKRKGGKENKSGLVSISNLARKLHTKQVGFARTLRDGGVDVVKCKSGYAIHVQDVEKAEQLLAPLKAALPEMKKIGLGDVFDASKQPDGPAVDFAMLGVEAANVGPMEENLSPWSFAGFTDQQLAGELRRRGYEVTATKTVVVSL